MSSISWWRSWHGAPTDHKWAVIAARAKAKVGIVSAVVWALLDYASQNENRGSVEGFDTETYAVYSGFSEDEIKAVMQAMHDKGVLKDNRFVNWEKRQPKREDDSTERVREFRAKKRIVTQSNAPDKDRESDTDKEIDTDKDKEGEGEQPAASENSPFDLIRFEVEKIGILPAGEKDIKSIAGMVEEGITAADVATGIIWKTGNNGGKAIRYLSEIIGPARTAMQIRLQAALPKPITIDPRTAALNAVREKYANGNAR